ncbi:hypothetical protein K469DRAFT_747154 [Zopfia rhizophila CBS 207.26]|uniref:Uncharacterized protein n=1 Tax=Zopfia rhizophila CBS 207.26 TaxID=1314779 RepID=A0A6A6EGW0_9PEZI|nr:hypothetical protein K469DRAFT_747154 [Zopfia rhizophila CBS 207.26]
MPSKNVIHDERCDNCDHSAPSYAPTKASALSATHREAFIQSFAEYSEATSDPSTQAAVAYHSPVSRNYLNETLRVMKGSDVVQFGDSRTPADIRHLEQRVTEHALQAYDKQLLSNIGASTSTQSSGISAREEMPPPLPPRYVVDLRNNKNPGKNGFGGVRLPSPHPAIARYNSNSSPWTDDRIRRPQLHPLVTDLPNNGSYDTRGEEETPISALPAGETNILSRPSPPADNSSHARQSEMEAPTSALPSRSVKNGLLPSPSSFYPEWELQHAARSTDVPNSFYV